MRKDAAFAVEIGVDTADILASWAWNEFWYFWMYFGILAFCKFKTKVQTFCTKTEHTVVRSPTLRCWDARLWRALTVFWYAVNIRSGASTIPCNSESNSYHRNRLATSRKEKQNQAELKWKWSTSCCRTAARPRLGLLSFKKVHT